MIFAIALAVSFVAYLIVTGTAEDDHNANRYAGLFGDDPRKENEAPTENPNVGKYLFIAALVAIAAVSIWERLQ